MAESEPADLLVLIVDINPVVWFIQHTKVSDGDVANDAPHTNSSDNGIIGQLTLEHLIDVLLVFINAHLMLHERNSIALIACFGDETAWIYPTPSSSCCPSSSVTSNTTICNDGQYELFARLNESIRKSFLDAIDVQRSLSVDGSTSTTIASALTQALCYLRRVCGDGSSRSITDSKKVVQHTGSGNGLIVGAHAMSDNDYASSTTSAAMQEIRPRILVVQSSNDRGGHYVPLMNGIFAAQKRHIPIDACVLTQLDSSLLQQAVDITNGVYRRISSDAELMQVLLTSFLLGIMDRTRLVTIPLDDVDYRATCICHGTTIDIGNVCSACLSVFCDAIAKPGICPACETRFKRVAVPPKR